MNTSINETNSLLPAKKLKKITTKKTPHNCSIDLTEKNKTISGKTNMIQH